MKAYAVVQLRQDNALGTLYNMVGFQTKLKHGEQVARLPHDPGPRERRVRAARRPAPQHLSQLAEAARRHAAPEGRAAACASPARSPAARAMSKAPPSGCSPAASPRPSGSGQALAAAAAHHGARRAARPHHRRPHRLGRRAGQALVPADERQFRPVPAARGAEARGQAPARQGQDASPSSRAMTGARAGRLPRLARACAARGRSRRIVSASRASRA